MFSCPSLAGPPAGKWCSLGPASCTGWSVYLGQLKKWRSGAFSSLFLCLLELCKMELTIHIHVTRKRVAATWHGHDFFFFTFKTTKYISSFLKTTQNISPIMSLNQQKHLFNLMIKNSVQHMSFAIEMVNVLVLIHIIRFFSEPIVYVREVTGRRGFVVYFYK